MTKKFWTSTEVVEIFQVDERFISELMDWDIVCPACSDEVDDRVFSPHDMEKLRIAKTLIKEMDVNMAGVEIILRMRQDMIAMRRQFDDILDEVQRQFKNMMKTRPGSYGP